jgi:bifunctional non-homologous end joining protein LigD
VAAHAVTERGGYDQRRMPFAHRSTMPVRIAPQLVPPTPTPPADEAWVHEVKHDGGHRIIAYVERGRVRRTTRAGNDATARFAPITEMLSMLSVLSAVLDGEIAAPMAAHRKEH